MHLGVHDAEQQYLGLHRRKVLWVSWLEVERVETNVT